MVVVAKAATAMVAVAKVAKQPQRRWVVTHQRQWWWLLLLGNPLSIWVLDYGLGFYDFCFLILGFISNLGLGKK